MHCWCAYGCTNKCQNADRRFQCMLISCIHVRVGGEQKLLHEIVLSCCCSSSWLYTCGCQIVPHETPGPKHLEFECTWAALLRKSSCVSYMLQSFVANCEPECGLCSQWSPILTNQQMCSYSMIHFADAVAIPIKLYCKLPKQQRLTSMAKLRSNAAWSPKNWL